VFIDAKDDGSGGDNWSCAKLQSNRHHRQTCRTPSYATIKIFDRLIGVQDRERRFVDDRADAARYEDGEPAFKRSGVYGGDYDGRNY